MKKKTILKTILSCALTILLLAFLHSASNAFFNSRKSISLPTRSQHIAIGDLNNDGYPDLVVGRWPDGGSTGNLSILLGRGNGDFRRDTTINFGPGSPYISDIKLGYFNKDQYLDIAVAHNETPDSETPTNDHLVSILLGSGSGRFTAPTEYTLSEPTFPSFRVNSLSLGDYDLDGRTDIYVAGGYGGITGGIIPLKNLGNGIFASSKTQVIDGTLTRIATANLNNDGKADVVVASGRGSKMLYGAANLYFSSADDRDRSRLQQALAVGDFNNDGKDDYAVTDTGRREIRVFINGPNGFPELPKIYTIKADIQTDLITADFNNDGNLDLAFPLTHQGTIKFMYGNGKGNFFPAGYIQSGHETSSLAAVDLNGDGWIDLVATNDENPPAEQIDVFINSPDKH